mmetsp:Transcript_82962/g.231457  ORF Transcript_82962/g.231457 Transcript_82962/m.231457 type:complete len:260 (+) Transcript_82962:97-876(+)
MCSSNRSKSSAFSPLTFKPAPRKTSLSSTTFMHRSCSGVGNWSSVAAGVDALFVTVHTLTVRDVVPLLLGGAEAALGGGPGGAGGRAALGGDLGASLGAGDLGGDRGGGLCGGDLEETLKALASLLAEARTGAAFAGGRAGGGASGKARSSPLCCARSIAAFFMASSRILRALARLAKTSGSTLFFFFAASAVAAAALACRRKGAAAATKSAAPAAATAGRKVGKLDRAPAVSPGVAGKRPAGAAGGHGRWKDGEYCFM